MLLILFFCVAGYFLDMGLAQWGLPHRAIALGWKLLAALAVTHLVARRLFDRLVLRLHLTVPAFVRDIAMAGAYAIVGMIVLSLSDVDLSGLIATSAVMTAIIAFSLQDTLGNLLGGMVLQLEQSVEIGDRVKFNDMEGVVREIRWRQTQLELGNGDLVIIPNSLLMKNPIRVLGRSPGLPGKRWVSVPFSVGYGRSPGEIVEIAERALRRDPPPGAASEPPPSCIITDFHDTNASFALGYYLTDLPNEGNVSSAVRARLHYALAREGIELQTSSRAVVTVQNENTVRERRRERELERRLAVLSGVPLFASLTPEELRTLAERLKHAPFAKGELLTKHGASGHWLYIIDRGVASVRLSGRESTEVAQLKAGDFMGEMALMTGETRAATVMAQTELDCYRLDQDGFRDILARRPEIAESISAVLAERRQRLENVREKSAARPVASLERVQKDLLSRIRSFFQLS
ncbi:MAG: mechanosensitive ion channel [Elusimicrobia bacterium]|nr:mechanosensitive ion channel [Elusimicrobiota bacterium]